MVRDKKGVESNAKSAAHGGFRSSEGKHKVEMNGKDQTLKELEEKLHLVQEQWSTKEKGLTLQLQQLTEDFKCSP